MENVGQIITFYSYKGGTGRSMIVANMAWILASSGSRVLAIDWDLEAPGLHKYFAPFLIDASLNHTDGLIEFIYRYAEEAVQPSGDGELSADWYRPVASIADFAVSLDWEFPNNGCIDLISAGRQGPSYAARVNSFNWQNFYDRLGGWRFLEEVRKQLRSEGYEYILIDSRTGVSDTAGICTVQMPDKLVVCFTHNNQSIEGASGVARSAQAQYERLRQRRLEVFPVPTRVDQAESERLNDRRGNAATAFRHTLASSPRGMEKQYWAEVEIPYMPIFSYEEMLSPFVEDVGDPKSTLAAYCRMAKWLTGLAVRPEDLRPPQRKRREIYDAYVGRSDGGQAGNERQPCDDVSLMEVFFAAMNPSAQSRLRNVLLRLVRVGRPGEGTELTTRSAGEAEFGPDSKALVEEMIAKGLLSRRRERGGRQSIWLADEDLFRKWTLIREWVEADTVFLFWRQNLQEMMAQWEMSGRASDALLPGVSVTVADKWMKEKGDELSPAEQEFVNLSAAYYAEFARRTISPDIRTILVSPLGRGYGHDFDFVDRELIQPAVRGAGHDSFARVNIFAPNEIRGDALQALITRDIVLFDVSGDAPDVVYQLALRHAFKGGRTIVIASEMAGGEWNLGVISSRLVRYAAAAPGLSVPALTEMISRCQSSNEPDSPIFLALPQYVGPGKEQVAVIPVSFAEEVNTARQTLFVGDLALFADEVAGMFWEAQGLRLIGRAAFAIGGWAIAMGVWDRVLELDGSDDLEANKHLATVHQKLGNLVASDLAVQRALKAAGAGGSDRAELLSLEARNAKVRWQAEWAEAGEGRRAAALRSALLERSAAAYEDGFAQDRNHSYSGLNALAMRTVETELAAALPEVWAERFDDNQDPAKELEARMADRAKLAVAVELSLASARQRLDRAGESDIWTDLSEADLRLLLSARPAAVANGYRRALAGKADFAVASARQQLELYRQLGVRTANVEAALAVLPQPSPPASAGPRPRVVLFTGHMIDAPGRKEPRFPPEQEVTARNAIRAALQAELAMPGGVSRGIAGGASGGDLLFHEACAELGVTSDLYLALPPAEFIAASVAPGGAAWVERFRQACDRLPRRELAAAKALPGWLQGKDNYDIWQRNNLWMLHNALAIGRDKVTLIALWDCKKGDGPGGTEHMVEKAQARGAKVVILETKRLFGLG